MWATIGVMVLTGLIIPLVKHWAKKRRENGKPIIPRLRRRRRGRPE